MHPMPFAVALDAMETTACSIISIFLILGADATIFTALQSGAGERED